MSILEKLFPIKPYNHEEALKWKTRFAFFPMTIAIGTNGKKEKVFFEHYEARWYYEDDEDEPISWSIYEARRVGSPIIYRYVGIGISA